MRKDKTDRNEISCRLACWMAACALCLGGLPSCDTEVTLPDIPEETVRATLNLAVSSFSQQDSIETRAVNGNTDEDRVRDLWVFQFNAGTGELMGMDNNGNGNAKYINDNQLDDIQNITSIDFIPNGTGEQSIVCVVANTHDKEWARDENEQIREGFKTIDGLRAQVLPDSVIKPFLSSNMGESGYTIPMYGESAQMVIASKAYIRVPLIRMFARVEVYVDPSYAYNHHLKIRDITYSNIPFYSRIKAITEKDEYPETIAWKDTILGNADDYIFYVPENMQGEAEGITNKSDADPNLIPPHALAIKIRMDHATMLPGGEDDDDQSHIHLFTVYPGMNMKNDFNIKRNQRYKISIKISNEPDSTTIIQP